MRTMLFLFPAILLAGASAAPAQSPYADQQDRAIKALSSERIAGLEAGRGLGYARPAELNGYPGPMHVLELADELGLSVAQLAQTRRLFETMRERASALGSELIAAEAALDAAFAAGGVTPERLGELVAASARVEGELRRVHLDAHLEQAALLDDEQVARYGELRGYRSDSREHRHRDSH